MADFSTTIRNKLKFYPDFSRIVDGKLVDLQGNLLDLTVTGSPTVNGAGPTAGMPSVRVTAGTNYFSRTAGVFTGLGQRVTPDKITPYKPFTMFGWFRLNASMVDAVENRVAHLMGFSNNGSLINYQIFPGGGTQAFSWLLVLFDGLNFPATYSPPTAVSNWVHFLVEHTGTSYSIELNRTVVAGPFATTTRFGFNNPSQTFKIGGADSGNGVGNAAQDVEFAGVGIVHDFLTSDEKDSLYGGGAATAGTYPLAALAGTAECTFRDTTSVGLSVAVSGGRRGVGGAAVYGYQWHRDTSPGFTPSGANDIVGATSSTLTDTGLIANTQYYYKCVITDADGTANSSEVAVKTIAAWTAQSIVDPKVYYSPWSWHSTGAGSLQSNNVKAGSTFCWANAPGAYKKIRVSVAAGQTGSVSVRYNCSPFSALASGPQVAWLVLDRGLSPPSSWDWREVIDEIEADNRTRYDLPVSGGSAHRVSVAPELTEGTYDILVWFSTSNVTLDRWTAPAMRVEVVGIDTENCTLGDVPVQSGTIRLHGDSILEKCWDDEVEGKGDDSMLGIGPRFADRLGCEFGQRGFSSQGYGFAGSGNVPAWNASTWLLLSNGISQHAGLPDYEIVEHGTNTGGEVAANITTMLNTIRAANPGARIVQLMTFSRVNVAAITTGYGNYAGGNAQLIDPGVSLLTFTYATIDNSRDNIHPSLQGEDQWEALWAPLLVSLSVVAPEGGEVVQVGSDLTVEWTSTGVNTVDVLLSIDNGATFPFTVGDGITASLGAYEFTTLIGHAGSQVKIKVVDEDNAGLFSVSAAFQILSPAITAVTAPVSGDILLDGVEAEIEWTSVFVDEVDILLSLDGGSTYPITIVSAETNNGVYAWTPTADHVSATAKIKVRSSTDALVFAESNAFIVATTGAAGGVALIGNGLIRGM